MKRNIYSVPDWGDEDTATLRNDWVFFNSGEDPSKYRCDLPQETIHIPFGENPFDVIEDKISEDEMERVWIIVEKSVLEFARDIPGIYHFDLDRTRPEVFNFNSHNFERSKIIHLNTIHGFYNWRIICAWIGKNKEEFIIPPENHPQKIIKVVMA